MGGARQARLGAAVLLVWVVLALARDARGQDAVPAPSPWLEGSRLVLEGAGCSVDTPGPGWRWLVPREQPPPGVLVLICENKGATRRFLFQVQDERFPRLTEAFAREFLEQFERPLAAKGLELRKIGCEVSDLPLGGRSFKFRDELVDASGKATFSRGYMTTAGRLYFFDMLSPDEGDPIDLQASVMSFRLLRSERMTPADLGLSNGAFVLLASFLAGVTVVLGAGLMVLVLVVRGGRAEPVNGSGPGAAKARLPGP